MNYSDRIQRVDVINNQNQGANQKVHYNSKMQPRDKQRAPMNHQDSRLSVASDELDRNDDDDDENDEENIVIDMVDEDELEDEEQVIYAGAELELASERPEARYMSLEVSSQNLRVPSERIAFSSKTITDNNNDEKPEAETVQQKTGARDNQFQVADLIWFDPNQLGHRIPGKIIDSYTGLGLITIEGHAQPAVCDPLALATSHYAAHSNELANEALESLVEERYNRPLLEAENEFQLYDLNEQSECYRTMRFRQPIDRLDGSSDLIDLVELSLESIVWNLKLRYKQDLVYTKCGQNILISMNPNKQLDKYYNLNQLKKYNFIASISNNNNNNSTQLNGYHNHHADTMKSNQNDNWKKSSMTDDNLLRWLIINGQASRVTPSTGQQEPHLFAVASEALGKLLVSGKDQNFVLLGDSGSGKTETAKLLVQCLAGANRSPSEMLTEQIMESIHLMESFGNARTQYNDNSSRFAKIMELSFDLGEAKLIGASAIDLGLLDRSRIVAQSAGERNYHIFYELLAGLEEDQKEKYGLQQASKYFYLNQGHCCQIRNKEDAHDFRSLMSSMQVLGFSLQERDSIFRLLASILHLGNVYFHRKLLAVRSGKLASVGQGAGVEGVEIGSDTELRWLSHLLQIQLDTVMRCLTVRTQDGLGRGRGTTPSDHQQASADTDPVVAPLNIDQALDTRDAIARTLYTCLFRWLIERINGITAAPEVDTRDTPIYGASFCPTSESLCEFQPDRLNDRQARMSISSRCSSQGARDHRLVSAAKRATISILDVFGFENLAENNFEQLCINYAAELIQYQAHKYLLRLEQAEYQRQRLRWEPGVVQASSLAEVAQEQALDQGASFSSSQLDGLAMGHSAGALVNLLSKKPLGILALLDDECNFPKATDQSFVEKCHHNHTLNDNYQRSRLSSPGHEFGVRHFQQQRRLVWYQVEGFVEKNRDLLRPDIVDMLMSSGVNIVVDMMRKLHKWPQESAAASTKTLSRTYDGRFVSMRPRATTLAAKFQDALRASKPLEAIGAAGRTIDTYGSLVSESRLSTIQSTGKSDVWFVICLKANQSKTALVYDVAHVQEQAKCFQLLELAKLRKFGYPIRMSYGDFVRQYKCLVPQKHLDKLPCARSLREGGRRRKKPLLNGDGSLKQAIRELCSSIVEFRFRSDARLLEQTRSQYQCGASKMFLNERLYLRLEQIRLAVHLEAVALIQRLIRGWSVRRELATKRRAAQLIQANWRGWLARQQFWRQYLLIVNLQRHWRHWVAIKRRRATEERRRLQRQQQQVQLQEIQAQQRQLADQFRFRVQPATGRQLQRRPGLDIPEELAHLYRLQRDWSPVHELCHLTELQMGELEARELRRRQKHGDKLMSVPFVASVEEPLVGCLASSADAWDKVVGILGHELANELDTSDEYSLQALLSRYLSLDSPQFGYSRLPITRPFTWSQLSRRRQQLGRRNNRGHYSLERVIRRYQLVELNAISIYKLILRYIDSDLQATRQPPSDRQLTGDQQAIYEESMRRVIKFKLIADYVIQLCIKEPLLRDEIFVQLASQSWQNPRAKSVENVWKLALNCLSCFGPKSRQLTKLLLRFSHDHCCPKYREQVLLRLSCYVRDGKLLAARRYPPTMLEYWANQEAIEGLALPASCYMDDHALNGPALDATEDSAQHSSLVNHSTKTLVRLAPWTSAESMAKTVLQSRRVPETNLFGWSVEVQHEGALSELSSRLRGDDRILDHFGRLELVPEFAALIEQPRLSAIEEPQEQEELRAQGRGSARHRDRRPREASMSEFSAPKRLSLVSQRSAESRLYSGPQTMADRRQLSDMDLSHLSRASSRARQLYDQRPVRRPSMDYQAAAYSRPVPLDNYTYDEHPAIYQTAGHCQAYQQPGNKYPMQAHRRSLSMQELQQAGCSMLNGRYLEANAAGHYAMGYQATGSELSPRNNGDRRGSLQRLGSSHHYQQPQLGQRRRSGTPNSAMAMSQASPYGYSMGGSLMAEQVGRRSRALTRANQNGSHQQQQQQPTSGRPRRSASSSSRAKPVGPSSDYASACSDYERVGGSRLRAAAPAKNPLVERYKLSARQAQKQRLTKRKQTEISPEVAQAAQAGQYLGSSALSDTSEAPSMASHVRAVKVPQHNADLDQYLDDLFNPMLDDADLDELSDARSLAFSIKGVQLTDDLADLCDPLALATIIRGTDEPAAESTVKTGTTSPKFESILESSHTRASEQNGENSEENARIVNSEEIEPIDRKLDNHPQEAQSSILEPPTSVVIRTDETIEMPPPPSPLPPTDDKTAASQVTAVGKLKISTEMKSKLELITNLSQKDENKAEPVTGIVSQATRSLLQASEIGTDKVKKINKERKLLLQSQLMGSQSKTEVEQKPMSPPVTGSKILAAKQLLAEAAGVTLDAFDSNPNSQASSRRQSAALQATLVPASEPVERRFKVMQDELGPQSEVASSQRRAFYGDDRRGTEAHQERIYNSPTPETVLPVAETASSADEPSVARSIGQRRNELLIQEPKVSQPTNQWVSSSPDPPKTRLANSRLAARSRPVSQMRPDELMAARKEHQRLSSKLAAEQTENDYRDTKCLTYGNVDWQVKIRKEIFTPSESYQDPLVVQLVFVQLVADVFNPRQWTRLNNKERAAMKLLMKDNSIGYAPSLPQIGEMQQVKQDLIRMARSFGLYFTRSYRALNFAIVHGDLGGSLFSLDSLSESSGSSMEEPTLRAGAMALRLMDRLSKSNNLGLEWIDSVAVHHSGLRLVAESRANRVAGQEPGAGGYRVIETLKFRDMTDVSLLSRHELLVSMRNGKKCWLISSEQATQLSDLLKTFHADYSKLTTNSANSRLANNQTTKKTQGKQRRLSEAQSISQEDALLAADDDHHGDHFKQRKTPVSVNKLRQKTDTNDDLADGERVLCDNLANNQGSSIKNKPSNKLNNDTSTAGRSSGRRQGSQHKLSGSQLSAADQPLEPKQLLPLDFGSRGARSSGRVSGISLIEEQTSSHSKQLTIGSATSSKRRKSLWHSSLSRMSNKFNIFAGGSQSRASTPGKSAGQPRARGQEDQQQAVASEQDNAEAPVVALDAWIETKVDFDQDEPEESDANNNSSTTDGASLAQEAASLSTDQGNQEAAEDGKHSMLQFALYNFRDAIDKYSLESRLGKTPTDSGTLRGSLKFIESLRSGSPANELQRAKPEHERKLSKQQQDWTWRELAELVKWTGEPLRQSLLKLPSEQLNKRALDCFKAIMEYMGDRQAKSAEQNQDQQANEVECVYLILMNCHNYPILRDELYCQLMKQTTSNRSPSADSCLRGWRLFAMLAAYFDCSSHLRPYLVKYLETAAYDKRRAYCSVASLCLQNLRKTFKYKGRKNVPSIEEIAAHSAGRNSKRQIYRLPGGTERVINTKSTTVVEDIIHEICANMLNVQEPQEMLEFSLYCIADGDLYTMPLDRDEYILDITTELIKDHQQYFLIFCRSVWHYPLRLDSQLYIEVIFNQIAPDYLEGLLLVLPAQLSQPLRLRTKLVKEVARIAALLHRASGTDYMPHKDEVRYLLPKPIVAAMRGQRHANQHLESRSGASSSSSNGNGISGKRLSAGSSTTMDTTVLTTPQKWVEMVQNNWRDMSAFDTLDAKAQFLDIVRHWPLFGSSFFAIKFIQRDLIQPMDLILALNKFGIQMLDPETHETIYRYPSNEVISTRKVRSEDGTLYLDLKCGNLMKRTIIRIQTDQAHEISRLIKQYIDIELMQQKQLQLQQQQQQQQPLLAPISQQDQQID